MPHPRLRQRDIRFGPSSARQGRPRAGSSKGKPAAQRGGRPKASPSRGATAKRLDLQGLRAVAVLLVALNHANVPFMRGGYIGVDVFFVLSGYFITGLLLRDGFGRDSGDLGRVSLREFYARRARRILPAACLTLLTTSIAVYVVYDVMRDDFLGTRTALEDALSASLFFANIHFAQTATNYFAQATTTMPSPFQHFWSLSVEEQFYVVWPSLLAGAFLICRRFARDPERRRRDATRLVGVLIACGCAAALVWSIRDTAADPQAAYFSTPARIWELGLGAGLALLAARGRPLPGFAGITRPLLSVIGIAMIAVAAVFYSNRTPFPGDAALLPVVGAGLVVLAGLAPGRVGMDRVLAARPLTYIGDRSYSFYLWHYPVLILVWQASGHVLGVGVNLALLAGAFLLSDLTFDFYENPLRFARWLRGWRTAAMAAVSMSAAVLAVLIPLSAFQATLAEEATAAQRAHVTGLTPAHGQPDPKSLWAATPIPDVSAAVSAERRGQRLPKAIVPSLRELSHENSYISYDMPHGCQPAFGPGVSSRLFCHLGDNRSKHVVALIGDSHAGMWMPALEADGRQQGFAVVPLDKPGCVLNVIHQNLTGWPCARWYQWAINADRKLHPLATIVTFEYAPPQLSDPSAATADMQAVLGQVRHPVLLADPPGQAQQPASCISKAGASMRTCSSRLPGPYVPLLQDLAGMTARAHVPAIPTLQWFCALDTCPMVIDNTLTLRDRSHFTMQFSTLLAPVLGLELKPILTRFEHR